MTYNDAMQRATRVTTKYEHYGPLYDLVLATLPEAPTVLEIGIANGGSLQTWREVLGPDARIIGVDLNERAIAMRDEGFEVYILDTGDPASWEVLRRDLAGTVDLLVDDGGHTNRQQVEAVVHGIDLVRDGGWIVIEDLHASFMREFGNPSPFSAVRYLNELASDLHRAHPRSSVPPKHPNLARSIEYLVSSTSWTALRVGHWNAASRDEFTAGTDATLMDYDHRWDSSSTTRKIGALLPGPVKARARDVALRLTQAVEMRSLFRADARSSAKDRSGPPTAR
ncbi:MAG: hypothetical protein JWM89_3935 [Acidimicrobiales bacterium]|nr:hypothetical protein [Acidimicrobiales bacterium]